MASRSLSDILFSVPPANRWKLDKEIDFEHKGSTGVASKHLGRIADSMTHWEGAVADHLNLSVADRSHIRKKYESELNLQRYYVTGVSLDASSNKMWLLCLAGTQDSDFSFT